MYLNGYDDLTSRLCYWNSKVGIEIPSSFSMQFFSSFRFCSESEFLVLSRGSATSVANVGTVPFFRLYNKGLSQQPRLFD